MKPIVVPVTTEGRCQLCGISGPLTFEHIPPKSAFNDQKVQLGVPELKQGEGIVAKPGKFQQRGAGVKALCADCNSLLGARYVPEYSAFVDAVVRTMAKQRIDFEELQRIDDLDALPTFAIEFRGDDSSGSGDHVYPMRIARQALSMLLVMAPPDFPDTRPALVDLVLDPAATDLPKDVRLGFCFFVADVVRSIGKAAIADLDSQVVRVFAEVSHPPLSWVIVTNGAELPNGLVDVTEWLTMGYDEGRVDFRVEALLGFGNSFTPIEYRTEGQLAAQAKANEAMAQELGLTDWPGLSTD